MPRFAQPLSLFEFKDMILKWCNIANAENEISFSDETFERSIYSALYGTEVPNSTTTNILKDLKKVDFDCENFYCTKDDHLPFLGFSVLPNGVPILVCGAGGDWEAPVHFILYPENNRSVRAYIPKEGNTYNVKAKSAYGNNEDSDPEDFDDMEVNFPLFIEDVTKRIVVK